MLSAIAKSSRFRFILIGLVLVILSVFSYSFVESIFFELYGSFLGTSTPHIDYPTPIVAHAVNRSSTKDGAFVFLALGAQANQMNCPAAIESLVKISGWSGHVYLLTDKSTCFDEPSIIRDSTIQSEKLHIVQMDEHFDDMNYGFDGKSIDLRRNRKKSFRVKTLLFEHIPDPTITTLAYVDCDILFGKPGCAERFITAGTPWSNTVVPGKSTSDSSASSTSPSTSVVSNAGGSVTTGVTGVPSLKVTIKFLNEQDGSFEGIHCGTMVLHRQHSAEGLRLWREQMDHGTEEDDNDAFRAAYFQVKASLPPGAFNPLEVEEIRDTGPPGIAPNSDPSHRKHFEAFYDPKNPICCMNHISKARCKRYGQDVVQDTVDQFHLSSYGGRYPYCPSPYVQPLLYGWFPFSLVDKCLKVEKLLVDWWPW